MAEQFQLSYGAIDALEQAHEIWHQAELAMNEQVSLHAVPDWLKLEAASWRRDFPEIDLSEALAKAEQTYNSDPEQYEEHANSLWAYGENLKDHAVKQLRIDRGFAEAMWQDILTHSPDEVLYAWHNDIVSLNQF